MSDATQGPGWWQASDGKWYPPDQHPDFTSPTQPVESVPTAATPPVPPAPPVAPTQAMAPVPTPPGPPGPPMSPAAPSPAGAPPPSGGSTGKVIAIVAVVAAIVVVAALLLANRDSGGGTKVAASDSAGTDQTDSTDQSASDTTTTKRNTTTTGRTTTTRPTTTTAAAPLDAAKLKARLLSVAEMGAGLTETSFTPDSTNPEACGQPNTDIAFPPVAVAGRAAAQANTHVVLEQVRSYADAPTSAKAFDTSIQGLSCAQGNAFDSNNKPVPITIGPVQDITGQVNGSRRAVAVTVTGQGFEGLAIGVDVGGEVVTFQFEANAGAGTETLEARLPVAQAGVDKLRAS